MDSLIHAAGWAQPPTRPYSGHFRSMSTAALSTSAPSSDSPLATPNDSLDTPRRRLPAKAPSTSALRSTHNYFDDMSTIPDPRSRSMTPVIDGESLAPNREPNINEEVTALSTKLINAINHQTTLDDRLSSTRHELEAATDRIKDLEAQNASQREVLAGDVWVRRSAADVEKKALHAQVAEERAQRLEMERSKKKIEQELENLTAALFEEANKMVIRAKEEAQRDHDALQKKNDQLKAQLADSEGLLKSQQDQLTELKVVMETMSSDRDDQTNSNTAPSSPAVARFDVRDDDGQGGDMPTASPNTDGVLPTHPMSFSHLIQPILRTDVIAYDDFVSLAKLSRKATGSRVSSGSFGGLNLPSLGLGNNSANAHPTNGSTTTTFSMAAGNYVNSAPQSPNTPASTFSNGSPTAPVVNLRDTKFFRRALAEDIEPTLRLDAAPGLSWLARRSVISAIADGSLVVDPVTTHAGNSFLMSITKPQFNPCSLCGESRKDPRYLRNHRFRTSEQESAQRYPLCRYCLHRVRSTCDFLSFLRMIKDGHWKADDDDQEKAAWEESVRLREQMFWARIGGGVVPCGQNVLGLDAEKSPRPSHEQAPTVEPAPASPGKVEDEKLDDSTETTDMAGEAEAPPVTEATGPPDSSQPSLPSTPPQQAAHPEDEFVDAAERPSDTLPQATEGPPEEASADSVKRE